MIICYLCKKRITGFYDRGDNEQPKHLDCIPPSEKPKLEADITKIETEIEDVYGQIKERKRNGTIDPCDIDPKAISIIFLKGRLVKLKKDIEIAKSFQTQ